MPFSAVIFDLDGTLLDSLGDIAWAGNQVLVQLGFPAREKQDYLQFVGEGVRRLFWRALPEEAQTEKMVDRCCEGFRIAYAERWNVETRPYDGIAALLEELQRREVTMAVLSNKPHEFTVRCVQAHFAAVPFARVLGQRDSVPRKPNPAGALEIADHCRRPSEQFLYVGDTAIDVETGLAAGMFPVGVLWGFRPREEMVQAGARGLAARPEELLRYFEESD